MAGINFAFIVVDSIKNAITYLFDSSNLLSDRDKEADAQIAVDIVSVESMDVIKTIDGRSNEAVLSDLKKKFHDLSDEWKSKYIALMKDINGAQATTGFPVLFLYTSIYSVIALLLIGISCCFPHNWNLEFFLCVFNLICVGEIIYFIHRVINRREKRMTIESFHCAIAIISAMLGAGVILGINIFCVSRGFVIPVVPWLCICVESFFVIIPSLALIVTIGYIFIEDIYFKCRIRRLYKVYQSKFREVHNEKLDIDKLYLQLQKPVYK